MVRKNVFTVLLLLTSTFAFSQELTLDEALKDALQGFDDVTYSKQISGSDFSKWHSEKINGFLTLGSLECSEMPGETASAWDSGNPAFATSGSKKWPTQRVVLKDGTVAAKLVTRKVFGTIASGSLFTGRIVRKMSLKQLLASTSKNGGQLINFGVKFTDRPKAFRVKFSYNGMGDECALSATLENRSEGKSDVVASALFIGSEETKNNSNCITKISEPDENGLRTLEVRFMYGEFPTGGNPLEEGLKQLPANTPITHVNVTFSSSAHGDVFKGVPGAELIIKDFEFVY